jgi:hypothetical protein
MAEITPEHWAFVEQTIPDFKFNLDLLAKRTNKDDIERHLSAWAIVLGVLALETFEAILLLIRDEKLRAAFMLSRALTEYHVRLRFYILQAKPIAESNRQKPIPEEHMKRQIHAIRDYKNADAKIADVLHKYRIEYVSDASASRFCDKLKRTRRCTSSTSAQCARQLRMKTRPFGKSAMRSSRVQGAERVSTW